MLKHDIAPLFTYEQLIAKPFDCNKRLWMAGVSLDFFANTTDMSHERFFIAITVALPYKIAEGANGYNFPCIFIELLKNGMLFGRKGKNLLSPDNLSAVQIYCGVSQDKGRRFVFVGTF